MGLVQLKLPSLMSLLCRSCFTDLDTYTDNAMETTVAILSSSYSSKIRPASQFCYASLSPAKKYTFLGLARSEGMDHYRSRQTVGIAIPRLKSFEGLSFRA